MVEVATRLSEIAENEVGSIARLLRNPHRPSLPPPPISPGRCLGIATPAQPAPRTGQPESVVQGPSRDSVTAGEGAKPTAETEIAKAQADEPAPAKAAPVAPEAVADKTEVVADETTPKPEQPAVVARKAKQPAAPMTTQVASVSPRVAVPPSPTKQTGGPIIVARDFAKRIPEAHVGLPVKSQKKSFVAMTLPLILAANEEISQRRSAIKRVAASGNRLASSAGPNSIR